MKSWEEIERNPKFVELVSKRKSLGWTLSAVMLIIYLGFIMLVAYAPKMLGAPLGAGVTTIGIPVGIFVIVSAFILTGIYVSKANAEFDNLTRQIVEESK
ncbi:MAG: DUF485 domain-containing protein [Rhodoblastus sp.]|nr:DUF485 domain-containing protein [Amphiplicatus sp.]MCB1536305.1 DUF485 domain-containing protein [Rhodoblastus sp.]